MNDFDIIHKLGEGAYSTVFRVRRNSDGGEYAMKKVRMSNLSEREKSNALNEVRILASINHPNIIAYKEAFFEDSSNTLCIIMEYADDGDLMKRITDHKRRMINFPEEEIWSYFEQIVRGLRILHEMKICHRDIKSANLFLTKEGVLKLGDLNVSKVNKKGMMRTQTGTPFYASPEVWKDRPYDFKSDIWSLGCVLYEMTTLTPPFRAPNMNSLYTKVLKGIYEPIPAHFSRDLSMMIRACLQVSQHSRPTCNKILELPYMQSHISSSQTAAENLILGNGNENLLNTILVPKNLIQIQERLPKPQYKMQRNHSLPAESIEDVNKLPLLADKKDNLILEASKRFGNSNSRVRDTLATIDENVQGEANPRSAEPRKSKALFLQPPVSEAGQPFRTPNLLANKAKALARNDHLQLPRISSIRPQDVTANSQNLGPCRESQARINKHQQENVYNPITGKRNSYREHKKILQKVYGACKIPPPQSHRREIIDASFESKRINPKHII